MTDVARTKEGTKLLFKKIKLVRTKPADLKKIMDAYDLPITVTNGWNETLIYNCAKHTVNIPNLDWLYEQGCDPHIVNKKGFNTYSGCLKWNHKKNKNLVLTWLHEHNIRLQREYEDLPELHNMIICYSDPDVYSWILDTFGKESLNNVDDEGNTPLHISCHQKTKHNMNYACTWLLKNDANPNIQNNYGETPLHLSAKSGFSNCTKYILNASTTDKTICNNDGHTPLQVIVQNKKQIKDNLNTWPGNYERTLSLLL